VFTHSKGENQKKTKLDRIGGLALTQKETVFNNIGHVVDLELLTECYHELDGKKAIGIDGVTKEAYGLLVEESKRRSAQANMGKVRQDAEEIQLSSQLQNDIDVRSSLNTAKANSTIGSRMREIRMSGSEEGFAGAT